jgi:hypothetical protein
VRWDPNAAYSVSGFVTFRKSSAVIVAHSRALTDIRSTEPRCPTVRFGYFENRKLATIRTNASKTKNRSDCQMCLRSP